MKQVPTNVQMHSLSSLAKADLSIYDSVDDQVLADYAVSFVKKNKEFTVSLQTIIKKSFYLGCGLSVGCTGIKVMFLMDFA